MLTPRGQALCDYMLGPGYFFIMSSKSTCLPRDDKRPVSRCWGPNFLLSCQIRAHAYPKSTSARWVHAGAWIFFLIMPNKSTCLPEEHKHPVSTCWGLIFLIKSNKSTCLPRGHKRPVSTCLGLDFFLSCQIRAHTYPENTSAWWAHALSSSNHA